MIENYSVYHSNFIIKNQKYLLLEISHAVNEYIKNTNKNSKNITWDYQNYNIFNLTTMHTYMPKLKKIVLTYIKAFFLERDIPYENGINIFFWVNYHENKNEIDTLKMHMHYTDFQGHICIDPLDTSTVYCTPRGDTLYEIENKIGLICISESKNLHYVKMNSDVVERPRVTIAFDIVLVTNQSKNLLATSNLSTELLFL